MKQRCVEALQLSLSIDSLYLCNPWMPGISGWVTVFTRIEWFRNISFRSDATGRVPFVQTYILKGRAFSTGDQRARAPFPCYKLGRELLEAAARASRARAKAGGGPTGGEGGLANWFDRLVAVSSQGTPRFIPSFLLRTSKFQLSSSGQPRKATFCRSKGIFGLFFPRRFFLFGHLPHLPVFGRKKPAFCRSNIENNTKKQHLAG